jgi:hypothetical protein
MDNPVHFTGNEDFEADSLARFAVFTNGNVGDRKDLPGQKEAKTRMFSKSLAKYMLFIFGGDPGTIILVRDHCSLIGL